MLPMMVMARMTMNDSGGDDGCSHATGEGDDDNEFGYCNDDDDNRASLGP